MASSTSQKSLSEDLNDFLLISALFSLIVFSVIFVTKNDQKIKREEKQLVVVKLGLSQYFGEKSLEK